MDVHRAGSDRARDRRQPDPHVPVVESRSFNWTRYELGSHGGQSELARGSAGDPKMNRAATRDPELHRLVRRQPFRYVDKRKRAAGLVDQIRQIAVVPDDRLAVDDACRRDVDPEVAVGRGAAERGHVFVETGQAAGRQRRVVWQIGRGAGIFLLPDRPQAINVAVVEEEDGIVRRGTGLHRSIDPTVNGVVNLARADPSFERVPEGGCRSAQVPRVAVIGGEAEGCLHARRSGQARSVAAEMSSEETEPFLIAIQDPSARLGERSRGHLVIGIARAVGAKKVGREREPGIRAALVLCPVPVGKGEIGIAGRILQFLLVQLQELAMPRAERRSPVGKVGPEGIVGPLHHHLMVSPDEIVVAADQRGARAKHAHGNVVGDIGDHVGPGNELTRMQRRILEGQYRGLDLHQGRIWLVRRRGGVVLGKEDPEIFSALHAISPQCNGPLDGRDASQRQWASRAAPAPRRRRAISRPAGTLKTA